MRRTLKNLVLVVVLAGAGSSAASAFGFLDYRHSADPWDNPCYRAYRCRVERERHYVFHHMSAAQAAEIYYGSCKKRGAWRLSSRGDRRTDRTDVPSTQAGQSRR